MSPYEIAALVAVALLVGFLIHKYLPSGAIAKAEDKVGVEIRSAVSAVKSDLPDVEEDALAALSLGMNWLTDTSSEVAAITAAQAAIAKKNALKAKAAASLSASA